SMIRNFIKFLRERRRPQGPVSDLAHWDSEEPFFSGEAFFASMYSAIEQARVSAWLQTYIIRNDEVGNRLLDLLVKAGKRGVDVRLQVDGLGSQDWIRKKMADYHGQPIEIRIFNRIAPGT